MARKDDLRTLAAERNVDVNQSDTIAELEDKLAAAGVDVPPEGDDGQDDDVEAALPDDAAAQRALGTDRGFTGIKVDPLPNEAYSLESGPESPGAAESRTITAAQASGELTLGDEVTLDEVRQGRDE